MQCGHGRCHALAASSGPTSRASSSCDRMQPRTGCDVPHSGWSPMATNQSFPPGMKQTWPRRTGMFPSKGGSCKCQGCKWASCFDAGAAGWGCWAGGRGSSDASHAGRVCAGAGRTANTWQHVSPTRVDRRGQGRSMQPWGWHRNGSSRQHPFAHLCEVVHPALQQRVGRAQQVLPQLWPRPRLNPAARLAGQLNDTSGARANQCQ